MESSGLRSCATCPCALIRYIDLSKRRVTPEEIKACEDKYAKSKQVHHVLRQVAEKRDMPLKTLYTTVGWPLYRKFAARKMHCYDAFKLLILDQEDIFEGESRLTGTVRSQRCGRLAVVCCVSA